MSVVKHDGQFICQECNSCFDGSSDDHVCHIVVHDNYLRMHEFVHLSDGELFWRYRRELLDRVGQAMYDFSKACATMVMQTPLPLFFDVHSKNRLTEKEREELMPESRAPASLMRPK